MFLVMINKVTKYDWIEGGLLLLVALCFTLSQYFELMHPSVLMVGTLLMCVLPVYYILTYKYYSLWQSNSSYGFSLLLYLWSFLFKCLVLVTFALSFIEISWVGIISTRSAILQILFVVDRLIIIPYIIVCLYKRAYKEACIAFIYDLYYQLLGPALTFFMYH